MTNSPISTPWQSLRNAVACLLLLPFLALSLLSPNVMAMRDTNGELVMVLCTPDGPVEMSVDLGSDAPKSGERCAWANAHVATLDYGLPALPPHVAIYHRAAPDRATQLWRSAYDPRNLWARGPPIFA